MLAVVAGHIWITDATRQWIYTWQLPLFFILSGYLWSGRRSWASEASLRARTLLAPYALWFVVIAAVTWGWMLLAGSFSLGVAAMQVWGGYYLTTPFWAFWFAPALFVSAFVYRGLSRFALGWQWLGAVALFVACAYIPGQPLKLLPLSVGQGLAVVLFLVAGRTLRVVRDRVPNRLVLGLGMLLAGVALIVMFPTSYIDVKGMHFGVPVVGIVTAILVGGGLSVTAEVVLSRLTGPAGRAVTWLSMASFVVMFVHVPIAAAFGWLDSESLPAFIVTVVASWAIGLALIASPRTMLLTGIRSAPPRLRGRAVSATAT